MSRFKWSWPVEESAMARVLARPPRNGDSVTWKDKRLPKFTLASDAEQRAAESLAATREGYRRACTDGTMYDVMKADAERGQIHSGVLPHIRDAWREMHSGDGLADVPLRARAVDHDRPVP